ncbi:hypothetical protein GEMRC1_005664 [Eukaryota sp. GEM-RC1]
MLVIPSTPTLSSLIEGRTVIQHNISLLLNLSFPISPLNQRFVLATILLLDVSFVTNNSSLLQSFLSSNSDFFSKEDPLIAILFTSASSYVVNFSIDIPELFDKSCSINSDLLSLVQSLISNTFGNTQDDSSKFQFSSYYKYLNDSELLELCSLSS